MHRTNAKAIVKATPIKRAIARAWGSADATRVVMPALTLPPPSLDARGCTEERFVRIDVKVPVETRATVDSYAKTYSLEIQVDLYFELLTKNTDFNRSVFYRREETRHGPLGLGAVLVKVGEDPLQDITLVVDGKAVCYVAVTGDGVFAGFNCLGELGSAHEAFFDFNTRRKRFVMYDNDVYLGRLAFHVRSDQRDPRNAGRPVEWRPTYSKHPGCDDGVPQSDIRRFDEACDSQSTCCESEDSF